MRCKCGYEGWAELGNFPDERFGGKYKDLPYMNTHYRCPKCKTNKNMEHINSIDRIREVLILGEFCHRKTPYPHKAKKSVDFLTGGADKSTVGYSINCPICSWGSSSAIPIEEYEKLKKEIKEGRLTGVLIERDCDTELRRIGIDPERQRRVFDNLKKR